MNNSEIENTIERYNQRLAEFGISEQAVGWGKKGRANLRFEILLSQWNIENRTILDFGCGLGFLFDYIHSKKKLSIDKYLGIDINGEFIKHCKEIYPADKCDFFCTNLFSNSFDSKVDYVFSSGVFNHKLENNEEFIKSCFHEFDKIATNGFAVNFLSNKVDFEYDYTYHADPAFILDLCYKYSNNVVLRNDYMPFEFTVFVNKAAQIDSEITVYSEFKKFV